MKQKLLIAIALSAVVLVSCKKDKKIVFFPTSNSYLPLTKGSTWQYTLSGGGADTLTITSTGDTSIVGGEVYYNTINAYKRAGITDQGFFFDIDHINGTVAPSPSLGVNVQLQMLNDTASVGYTWTSQPTSSGQINGIAVQAVNKILGKNISWTVGGHTFTSVIHTQTVIQYNEGGGNFQTFVTYDFYLAKGIGLVEQDENLTGAPAITEKLFNYSVK